MARKGFFSFNFNEDHWRASQVRNMGIIEGNSELSDNDWEALKNTSDSAVKNWIDGQLSGKSCTIVLVGQATAGRKWINYEIERSWELKKGVVGIRVHKLLNSKGTATFAGSNPFNGYSVSGTSLSSIVTLYDPPGADSKSAYKSIADNIDRLVEEAITIRGRY